MSEPLVTRPNPPIEEDPGSRQAPRHRVLTVTVILLAIVLAILAVIVLSALTLRAVKPRGDAAGVRLPGGGSQVKAILPAGARLISVSIGAGRVIAVYDEGGRSAALVLDADSLAPIGTIEAAAP